MELAVVGINYKSADVDVRERYAVAQDLIPMRCTSLTGAQAVGEAVIISTCNRVEYYVAVPEKALLDDAISAARAALGPSHPGVYTSTGVDAARHLFRVSGSLDSMVLGEPQILGQVKEAFGYAQSAGTVGKVLNGCFTRAFRAAKRVRSETSIARSAVSVGYVAVELAKTIFGEIGDVSVLLVGAGKMGVLAAKNLSDSGAKRVLVANRTFSRGQKLADKHGWSASAYGDLSFLLQGVDVVICSTGAARPVLTADLVRPAAKKRRYRPLFLIDIAVPRDIEPACGDINDVYLYNIDDLEEVSRSNREVRAEAARLGESIVEEELLDFEKWRRERQAAPTIRMLREKALSVATAEAAKTVRMLGSHIDEKSATTINKLAEVIASRLIRGPIAALKQSAGDTNGEDVAALVQRIFDLETTDEP